MTKRRAPSSPVFPLEPKRLTKKLIDHLINDVAIPALAGIDARTMPAVINAKVADEINIEAGKEDLEGNVGTLFRILDRIPDNQEREAAFWALYHVIHGTFRIAKSGIYPIDEMRHSYGLQAAMSRARREQKTTERNKIVHSVIDETKKRGNLPPKRLLGPVNARLEAVGKKKISLETLYRILERRRQT